MEGGSRGDHDNRTKPISANNISDLRSRHLDCTNLGKPNGAFHDFP